MKSFCNETANSVVSEDSIKASVHSRKRGFDHSEDFLIMHLLTGDIDALTRTLLADHVLSFQSLDV